MIIDLDAERGRRDMPDPELLLRDCAMQVLGVFVVDYQMYGRTYSIDIIAHSWAQAEAHLKAIVETGKVEGQLVRRSEQ